MRRISLPPAVITDVIAGHFHHPTSESERNSPLSGSRMNNSKSSFSIASSRAKIVESTTPGISDRRTVSTPAP